MRPGSAPNGVRLALDRVATREILLGIGIDEVDYLVSNGYFSRQGVRVLDIGAQNLHNATPEAVRRVAQKRDGTDAAKLGHISQSPDTLPYVSELFELLGIEYTSFDVCPGIKTEIFDLNIEQVPDRYRCRFDVVLNCGTTEHVVNQLNAFRVIHDATAVGGISYHQLPAFGYARHGYFCYHEPFFRDLAAANGSEIVDLWFIPTGEPFDPSNVDIRKPLQPLEPNSARSDARVVQSYNIAAVIRKDRDVKFSLPLEISTSSAPLPDAFLAEKAGYSLQNDHVDYRRVPARYLISELGRRVSRRLRRSH
jgi:hypothetical protein